MNTLTTANDNKDKISENCTCWEVCTPTRMLEEDNYDSEELLKLRREALKNLGW